MPKVLRVSGFEFYFFSNERTEPMHVHVESGERLAKFWLSPVSLAWNAGFRPNEITRIRQIIVRNQEKLQEAWNDFFAGNR